MIKPTIKSWQISGSSQNGYPIFSAGDVIRNPDCKEPPYLKVMATQNKYYSHDGRKYAGEDTGWLHTAYVRAASEDEVAQQFCNRRHHD